MKEEKICIEQLETFRKFLKREEYSRATVEKYMRDVRRFYEFAGVETVINKEIVIGFKEWLQDNYKVSSANSMIAAVNCFLSWMNLAAYRVKSLKHQRKLFCVRERELSMEEYRCVIEAAQKKGNCRLEMILQALGGTGIRISELPYITVEAVQRGFAVVSGKGKERSVFITGKLRQYLKKYYRKAGVTCGSIFVTRSGKPLNRSNLWREMKALCRRAGVSEKKIFPHNLRHLFARTYYKKRKDIVYLADILGHSSVETTRIYTISSGTEQERILAGLGLVL